MGTSGRKLGPGPTSAPRMGLPLSLRDHFASIIAPEMLSQYRMPHTDEGRRALASMVFDLADAMAAESKKRNPPPEDLRA